MENLTMLKEIALGDTSLEVREEAGVRMVKEFFRLKDVEGLESMADRNQGYLPMVVVEASNKLIDLLTEKRSASSLRKIAEDEQYPMNARKRAWENAKLCALSMVSGINDLDSLRKKHSDFVKNTPMQKKPKSIPPPRLTPVDKLRARKKPA